MDWEKLSDLVHDQASQIASNTVNGGEKDMIDYLLANGWTMDEITAAAGEG